MRLDKYLKVSRLIKRRTLAKEASESAMLSGHFENCYGIKEFDMGTGIDFSRSNKAIIYAPNGVMKTSFTKGSPPSPSPSP